jgi:hypothetical protein
MTVRPRIIFDTTGINKLEDGGSASEPLMRALENGYEVKLDAENRTIWPSFGFRGSIEGYLWKRDSAV